MGFLTIQQKTKTPAISSYILFFKPQPGAVVGSGGQIGGSQCCARLSVQQPHAGVGRRFFI
ncbi:hypothetical protein [Sphingobium sp. KCTC 72723]|uniref:hypothetical protein n=1 Tax=Sphingobium sp. KCTC 72723 TaxID=2733867 RepID=UPI00165E42FB|nr:hypothetical protein [Sphingobium sp. KCTC 72723]